MNCFAVYYNFNLVFNYSNKCDISLQLRPPTEKMLYSQALHSCDCTYKATHGKGCLQLLTTCNFANNYEMAVMFYWKMNIFKNMTKRQQPLRIRLSGSVQVWLLHNIYTTKFLDLLCSLISLLKTGYNLLQMIPK